MSPQPSLLSGYMSALLRAIEATKNDPVQLRSLIYELARISLGKQILMRYDDIGSAELRLHLFELESAIKRVEYLSQDDEERLKQLSELYSIEGPVGSFGQDTAVDFDSSDKDTVCDSSDTAVVFDSSDRAVVRYNSETAVVCDSSDTAVLDSSDTAVVRDSSDSAVVLDSSDTATVDDGLRHNRSLITRRAVGDFYYEAHPLPTFLKSRQDLEPAQTIERLPNRIWSNVSRTIQVLIAAIAIAAIYIGFIQRSDYATNLRPPHPEDVAKSFPAASKSKNGQTDQYDSSDVSGKLSPTSRNGMPDFEMPTLYGVYAVNDKKLFKLDSLPIKVPDQRIAISAMISKPSPTTIPNGNISFVVFRRDLPLNAPDKVFIRVVARVVREMKFSGFGPAKTVKIDDQWVVRSNSYEFGVAPLNNDPEMLTIRAASPDFILPAGRYALALKWQAFDFNVGGQITDAAQCLERTEAVGGAVYSECRKTP